MLNLTKALALTLQARDTYNTGSITALFELEQLIKDEISLQNAKGSGNVNTYKALQKLIEAVKKNQEYRKNLHGVWIDKITEKQYFCNGYIMIEINNPIEGLEQIPDSETKMNPKSLLPTSTELDYPYTYKIDLTEVKNKLTEVKAIAKAQNKDAKWVKASAFYQMGESYFACSLILDVVSVLGKDISVFTKDGENKPCMIESSLGRALVMPIKVNKEKVA